MEEDRFLVITLLMDDVKNCIRPTFSGSPRTRHHQRARWEIIGGFQELAVAIFELEKKQQQGNEDDGKVGVQNGIEGDDLLRPNRKEKGKRDFGWEESTRTNYLQKYIHVQSLLVVVSPPQHQTRTHTQKKPPPPPLRVWKK